MGALAMKKKNDIKYVSQERMRGITGNIYEAVMISALEARRINLEKKMLGTQEESKEKVTTVALDRLLGDELHHDYRSSEDKEDGK